MAGNDKATPRFAPVILAGGSGTRFWPRSRRARAKQVLALDGERTADPADARPSAVARRARRRLGHHQHAARRDHRRATAPSPPAPTSSASLRARNTAPACALAAFLLEPSAPKTVIGIFPLRPRRRQHAALRRSRPRRHRPGCQRRAHRRARRSAHAAGDRLRLHRAGRSSRPDQQQNPCPSRQALHRSQRRAHALSSLSPPATTHGTAVSSCCERAHAGQRHHASTSRMMAPLLERRSPPRMARPSSRASSPRSTRSARTSPSTTPSSSRAQPKEKATQGNLLPARRLRMERPRLLGCQLHEHLPRNAAGGRCRQRRGWCRRLAGRHRCVRSNCVFAPGQDRRAARRERPGRR